MKSKLMRSLCAILLLFSFAISVTACGEDDTDNGGRDITGNNNQPDPDGGGDDDVLTPDVGGDADPTPDAGPDAEPDTDVDAEEPVGDLCEAVENLGLLEAASGFSVTFDTAAGSSLVEPTCGVSGSREIVVAFHVDEPLQVHLDLESADTNDWTMELYEGSCDDSSRVKCEASGGDTFIAEEGKNYMLAIETGSNATDAFFTLDIEATALACAPLGSSVCEGSRVTHCETGFQEASYSCPYACDGDACGGDTCEGAFEVAGSGSQSFSGAIDAYKSRFNFDGRASCSASGAGVNTPGQDLVFSLPDVGEGDEIIVDASAGEGQYAIFIMEGCARDEECVAGGLQVDEILEWEAPSAGDFHVIVDTLDQESGDFDITITR